MSCKAVSGSGASSANDCSNNFSNVLESFFSSTISPEISSLSSDPRGIFDFSRGIIAIIMAIKTNSRRRFKKKFLINVKNLPTYLNILQIDMRRSFIVFEMDLSVMGGVESDRFR
jgi:hypothetical protein